MNTKGSDTLVGRLRKAGFVSGVYLFILIFFYLFFVRVSLECKDAED